MPRHVPEPRQESLTQHLRCPQLSMLSGRAAQPPMQPTPPARMLHLFLPAARIEGVRGESTLIHQIYGACGEPTHFVAARPTFLAVPLLRRVRLRCPRCPVRPCHPGVSTSTIRCGLVRSPANGACRPCCCAQLHCGVYLNRLQRNASSPSAPKCTGEIGCNQKSRTHAVGAPEALPHGSGNWPCQMKYDLVDLGALEGRVQGRCGVASGSIRDGLGDDVGWSLL